MTNAKDIPQTPPSNAPLRWLRRTLAALASAVCIPAGAQDSEALRVPDLSAMLPERVLSSGHHRIVGAQPDGPYRLAFEIETETMGTYSAQSLPMAMLRVHELQTLAQAISQYQKDNEREADETRGQIRIGGDSVVDILGAPLSTGSQALNQFGRNVDRTFSELGRFPGPGVDDPTRGATLPADDPVLASHRRSAASQLNLDLYSTNTSVQNFLLAVARARMNGLARAGITTVSLARSVEAQVAGGAVQNRARSAVLDAENRPLDARNQALLADAGVPNDTIARFLAQPTLTPTHKTLLTEYLRFMDGVGHRDALIQAIMGARDEVDAMEGLQIARMYAYFHEVNTPLARFVASGRLPLALAGDGTLVVALPFDVLNWDAEAQRVFNALADFASRKNIDKRQVLVNGVATAKTKQSLARLGFGTVERYLLVR